jgi:hypothetical protein
MPFLDYSEYDPKNLNKGAKCEIPGKCCLLVTAAIFKDGDNGPYYRVTFDILAHEDPKAVGQEWSEFFNLGGKGGKFTQKFAEAVGDVTDEKLQNSFLTGKKGMELTLAETAPGKRVFVKIVKNTWKGETKLQIWDWWADGHPSAADFPRPPEKKAGEEVADPSIPVVDAPAADDADDLPF